MTSRTAMMIAAGITAWVLLVAGGVAFRMSQATATQAQPAAPQVPAAPLEAQIPQQDAATAPSYPVTADQALAAAQASAPGAVTLRAPELVDYQGSAVYEVALDQGMVYVDATTGALVASTIPAVGSTGAGRGEHEGRGEEGEHEGEDD